MVSKFGICQLPGHLPIFSGVKTLRVASSGPSGRVGLDCSHRRFSLLHVNPALQQHLKRARLRPEIPEPFEGTCQRNNKNITHWIHVLYIYLYTIGCIPYMDAMGYCNGWIRITVQKQLCAALLNFDSQVGILDGETSHKMVNHIRFECYINQ